MTDAQSTRALLLALHDRALSAARPDICLAGHLPPPPLAPRGHPTGRLVIFAIGKAAASMALAAENYYATVFPETRLEGLALTRYGHALPLRHIEVMQAAHPVPDAAGMAASARLLALAQTLTAHDLALVLLSGGGSALATLPVPGLSLATKQSLTRALLASGAPIADINCLRKHLSMIKGGWLARAITPAHLVTLAISDVAGDAPSTIASGPTVPDPTTKADARAIYTRWQIDLPEVAATLEAAPETPKPGDPCFAHAQYRLVGSGQMALAAAASLARAHGYETLVLGDALEGEARDLATSHAALALSLKAQGKRIAILSGGEAGVTFASNQRPGAGGPNQEYALSLARALQGASDISALAADTDGIDGGSGAAHDPAGAMIFPDTLARATKHGLDARISLSRHDSGTFFKLMGDLLQTGPSYTNVNDFRVILIGNDRPPRS